jgi:hypothetical protein
MTTTRHTQTHTQDRTSSSLRPLPIHNTQQNTERNFHENIWIQTHDPMKEIDIDLHIEAVS